MTLEQVEQIWDKVYAHRKEAFPDRRGDWLDHYMGTGVRIYHGQYYVSVSFFCTGEDEWDLWSTVYFADVRYNLTDQGFKTADIKDVDKLMDYIDKCLDRIVMMPDTITLIKKKWKELWSK